MELQRLTTHLSGASGVVVALMLSACSASSADNAVDVLSPSESVATAVDTISSSLAPLNTIDPAMIQRTIDALAEVDALSDDASQNDGSQDAAVGRVQRLVDEVIDGTGRDDTLQFCSDVGLECFVVSEDGETVVAITDIGDPLRVLLTVADGRVLYYGMGPQISPGD